MRIDKFLKVSRIIKRRSVATDMTAAGRVLINGKTAKPATAVKPGDIVAIGFGQGQTTIRVIDVRPVARKEEAGDLYEIVTAPTKATADQAEHYKWITNEPRS